jgi:hypothetical protein
MATDEQLRAWGLSRLIDQPEPETEAVTRWRRVLAGEPAAPADANAVVLAAVAAEPYDPARYAGQRQALGLDRAGTDGQGHAHLDRWSR